MYKTADYKDLFSPDMDWRQVDARLLEIRNAPGGLEKIGQQMLTLLKRDLLYDARGRQLFQIHKLGQGEEAVYDADVRVKAFHLSVEGVPLRAQVRSDRVRIETSPIATRQYLRWNETDFRKFDILTRANERARAAIAEKEDVRAFALIETASTGFHPAILNAGGSLDITAVVRAITTLRQFREAPSKVLMTPVRHGDVMLWNITSGGGGTGIYSPQTQEALQRAGRVAYVWGVEILESDRFPLNRVYVIAPPEYLGVMAIRTDLTVETLKDPNQFADVVSFWENVGWVIRFSKALIAIRMDNNPPTFTDSENPGALQAFFA